MAKMKLSESTFRLIPEGAYIFKVMEVDDSQYEDFGEIKVKLQTAKGETHTERFGLQTADGEINQGALKAWSYFARTCLNNFKADEIDTQDIVGCYLSATVKHEEFTYTKGEKKGKTGINVKLNDYAVAVGFGTDNGEDFVDVPDDLDEDLDDFLN